MAKYWIILASLCLLACVEISLASQGDHGILEKGEEPYVFRRKNYRRKNHRSYDSDDSDSDDSDSDDSDSDSEDSYPKRGSRNRVIGINRRPRPRSSNPVIAINRQPDDYSNPVNDFMDEYRMLAPPVVGGAGNSNQQKSSSEIIGQKGALRKITDCSMEEIERHLGLADKVESGGEEHKLVQSRLNEYFNKCFNYLSLDSAAFDKIFDKLKVESVVAEFQDAEGHFDQTLAKEKILNMAMGKLSALEARCGPIREKLEIFWTILKYLDDDRSASNAIGKLVQSPWGNARVICKIVEERMKKEVVV